jgi:thiol-disulfide isomerase/thioredoxin
MTKGVTLFCSILIAIIVLAFGWTFFLQSRPGRLDSFAQCIKDKGVIFYGAFWCPHCQNTKAMFGKSAKLLPYVECSTPDGRGELPVCKDLGITKYPTWMKGNSTSTVLTGKKTLQELSEFSGCALPQ